MTFSSQNPETIISSQAYENKRLDVFLANSKDFEAIIGKKLSRSDIARGIRMGGVQRKEKEMETKPGHILSKNELFQILSEKFERTPIEIPLEPDLPVRLIHETPDILVIDKPAGIAVHQSTRDLEELTLENAVCHYLGGNISPHPVSRLDRGTSGLMAFAKSGYVHERLRRQMHTDAYRRTYLGVAMGHVAPSSGTIELPIGMAEGSTYQRAIRVDGQRARTVYETLAANEAFTLLRLIPETGRTHQLRLHLSAIGYPLVGDWLYGAEDRALIARPALHSYELSLTHPLTGQELHFTSPLPEDMRRLIDFPTQKEEDEK